MKKARIILAALLCLSLLAFAGCGNSNNAGTDSGANNTVTEDNKDSLTDDMADGAKDLVDDAEDTVDDLKDDAEDAAGGKGNDANGRNDNISDDGNDVTNSTMNDRQ